MSREKKERNEAILKEIKEGNYQVDIAKKFNVQPAIISKIKKRYEKRNLKRGS